jgi:hypothetical protein
MTEGFVELTCIECGGTCDGSVRDPFGEPLCLICGDALGYTEECHEEDTHDRTDTTD